MKTAVSLGLPERIEQLFEEKPGAYSEHDCALFEEFRALLNAGELRAAEPDPSRPTGWRVNSWIKKGILLGFRIGGLVQMGGPESQFFDKSTYPLRQLYGSGRCACCAGWIEHSRRLLRGPGGDVHAAHVHQCRSLRSRGHDGGFTCAYRAVARRSDGAAIYPRLRK